MTEIVGHLRRAPIVYQGDIGGRSQMKDYRVFIASFSEDDRLAIEAVATGEQSQAVVLTADGLFLIERLSRGGVDQLEIRHAKRDSHPSTTPLGVGAWILLVLLLLGSALSQRHQSIELEQSVNDLATKVNAARADDSVNGALSSIGQNIESFQKSIEQLIVATNRLDTDSAGIRKDMQRMRKDLEVTRSLVAGLSKSLAPSRPPRDQDTPKSSMLYPSNTVPDSERSSIGTTKRALVSSPPSTAHDSLENVKDEESLL